MWNNKIGVQFFINSFVSITLTMIFVFVLIFALLPPLYLTYMDSELAATTETIVSDVSGMSIEEQVNYLDNLVLAPNYTIMLFDQAGNIIFMNDEIEYSIDELKYLSENQNDQDTVLMNSFTEIVGGQEYKMVVVSTLLPAENIRKIASILLPIILVISLLISSILSWRSSKRFTKPLVILGKKTEELSKLNFDCDLKVKSKNELGLLSDNLDIVSFSLKESINKLKNEAELANMRDRERRKFFASLSHELKTPLTILHGQNEMMQLGIGDYADRDKYLKESMVIIEQMEHLVQHILMSSRLEEPDFKINIVKVDASKIVNAHLQNYAEIIEQKNINANCKIYDGSMFDADAQLFSYLVKNIIENAVLYCDEGGYVSVILTDNAIEVRNTNSEFDDSRSDEYFNAFVTTDSSRSSKLGGSGMGMFIIKKACELHDFKIEFFKDNQDVVLRVRKG